MNQSYFYNIINQVYFNKTLKNKRKTKNKEAAGVPTVVQQDRRHLWSSETQVQFLAQHSGLKDPVLPQLWHKVAVMAVI